MEVSLTDSVNPSARSFTVSLLPEILNVLRGCSKLNMIMVNVIVTEDRELFIGAADAI